MLDKCKQTGNNKYMAICPAHKDKSPSLSVTQGQNGRIVVYCFAGCSLQEIATSLNLKVSDFFAEDREQENNFVPKVKLDAISHRLFFCTIFLSDVSAKRKFKLDDAKTFNKNYKTLINIDLPFAEKHKKDDLVKKIQFVKKMRDDTI